MWPPRAGSHLHLSFIDLHVHLREPGREDEDETAAELMGVNTFKLPKVSWLSISRAFLEASNCSNKGA